MKRGGLRLVVILYLSLADGEASGKPFLMQAYFASVGVVLDSHSKWDERNIILKTGLGLCCESLYQPKRMNSFSFFSITKNIIHHKYLKSQE